MAPKTALLLALTFAAAAPTGFAEDVTPHPPPCPNALTPAFRFRVDRAALQLPGDLVIEEVFRSVEDLAFLLFGAGDVTAKEEVRLAAAAQDWLLDGRPTVPTPAGAQRVLDRLVAELPPYLRPDAFPYRLTVLDRPGDDAFTNGGGFVCITRPWLSKLLGDSERGEAALAFVLADEVAHVALGHCRRGWEVREAAATLAEYAPIPVPRDLPRGPLGDRPGVFSYTPAEQDQADHFALHLCRNAGFDLDAAMDALRFLAAGDNNDKDDIQCDHFSEESGGQALIRLKRVLQERDGLFDEDGKYGLFVFDRRSGRLDRCVPGQIGPGERPVVIVHGLRGNEYALADYLIALAKRPDAADRPLLVFRYPNNGSLSRAGQLLTREMRRCVAEPGKAVFVCHSAGGLVFRWYAEVRDGDFDRAIFLAVPQAGARTAELKGFVDGGRFLLDLSAGLGYALDNAFGEGDGQIAADLHPDSLFLRRLRRETTPVARYQIFYGKLFDWVQALEVQVAFAEAKRCAREAVAVFVPFPQTKARLIRLIEQAPLPEEFTCGDLVVSVRSALLPGVARTTALPLQHEAFRYDPDLVRRVTAAVLGR